MKLRYCTSTTTMFSGLLCFTLKISCPRNVLLLQLYSAHGIHCKPGEAYMRLKTASCEAGPGTTHMCTLEICIWSLRIPNNADRCALNNSIIGFSKCYLYSDPMKYLKLSCQGSNPHPSNRALSLIQISKVFSARIKLTAL
jgi:hypothetical protein